MKLLFLYLLLINALAFTVMLVDKKKAVKNRWRIPERTLLGIAAVGGSLGAVIAMQLLRHKTKHPRFSIGLPCMLAVHIVALILILSNI